jgi:hypothetical protein
MLPGYADGHDAAPEKERDDLVYIPHLDEQRDAELMASESMPAYLLE